MDKIRLEYFVFLNGKGIIKEDFWGYVIRI